MARPRVLIVWQNPLFQAAVEAILTQADIRPVALVPAKQALGEVAGLAPDVILVEGGHREAVPLLDRLEGDVRILSFTLDDDHIHFYQHRQWHGLDQETLLSTILAKEQP